MWWCMARVVLGVRVLFADCSRGVGSAGAAASETFLFAMVVSPYSQILKKALFF